MAEHRVLIDTGPLVALLSENDAAHCLCTEALASLSPPLLTCWPVLTEAAWLLRKRPLALEKLLQSFDTGLLALLPLDADVLPWIAAFLRRYASIEAQLADASLVYLAERENIRTVFTLDRRDFSVYRIKRNRALKILPDLP